MIEFNKDNWAVILGGSSGFGLATAKKLGRHGMNILIVHRDRRGAMERVEKEFAEIRQHCPSLITLNVNALSVEGRDQTLEVLRDKMGEMGKVRLLMHSIAFGNLKPIAPVQSENSADLALERLAAELSIDKELLQKATDKLLAEGVSSLYPLSNPQYGEALLGEEDMELTIYSMGSSILTWVQELHKRSLFATDARVIGLTSEGNTMAWKGYAAVAAAKVAMESIIRSIAVEFAPYGIRANILQPGVTVTPALKLIPGSDRMQAVSKLKNPFKRMTTPADVANFVALMCTDEAAWVNGSLIRVDGGEQISSL